MSSLPKGWMITPLDNIASWGSGGTPKRSESSYYGGDIPWVKTGDLGPKYLKEASEYITQLGLDKSSAKLFKKGSVAIAMYGATIGKTSILKFDTTTNQACAVGQPIDGTTTTEFLYYFLNSEKQVFIKKGKGGAQPNISQQLIKAHMVRLPPLAEQKRIVEKLDEVLAQVDTIKARLDGIPSLLKRFRQSVLASAVSGKLTEEWRGDAEKAWKKGIKLDSLCESSFYGPRFSKDDYSDVGIPTIRTTDMTANGGINVTPDTPRILVPDEKMEQFKVNKGDLLVTRTGSVGVMAIFTGDYLAIPSAYLIRFRFNPSVLVEYVYIFLTSPVGQEIMGLSATTTTQPNINAKSIRNIEIDLPSIKEQKEIVRLVEQYFAFADTIEAQVKKAQARVNNLTQSILAKAFRGELVPQDPNDEPADKLLERIAQAYIEAEALAKAAKKAETARKKAEKATAKG
ncbi:restriction endonuclease subunit S [Aliivibrio sp. S4TY2]|uniref:restriction endonuclease subunit S n=1 Tax=unclassified Aliivibrio TaxID=2645654 RepID=UPI0023790E11|nr:MULTISPECIES: restriction endonuclease subunit S [unclassified Aliivibrio]MDD9156386.1 restriction endonuclease subunit S [Aliivibrio sp. S4TY2]MDD9160733.1 restriction endonuclease subunit S [Aliivibrio sp. S4TY1]MDD9164094.1 restriction endonuclease subunit S [Aliivibrio sp. S4MY2]MDD9167933.1 restriction endonuclease subunit S [Aliivibrio sp. S4MY4]MDD9185289.1 restriction endonuclease subunit S [Aliivibrio sp. S4MY3]